MDSELIFFQSNEHKEVFPMAYYYQEPCHTFSEYLLIPGYTGENCIPSNVSLRTALTKYRKGAKSRPSR